MPLAAGTRLAHYEILEPIGKGGMGEVYRARDTKLGRDVAIKVLPEEFARDKERLARFEREAKVLASLNHPNIAAIYGIEESDGVNALVLELVEGPTLAERIAEGPVPIEETLAIARQIAEALEAGHEAGVVHRDVKPANVKLKEDGTVKVLDYGLAKALEGDAPSGSDSELSQAPTLTRQGTQIGVILGTAAYMSPEQAKGKRVDKRTDIWAFGCCVFEVLTAERAFTGNTVSETMAGILEREPNWGALPARTPSGVRTLLRRCLRKDASRRLHDIADARIELEELLQDAEGTSSASSDGRSGWKFSFLVGVAIVATLVAGLATWRSMRRDEPAIRGQPRMALSFPRNHELSDIRLPSVALSPDGSIFAYVAATAGGREQIFVRPTDRFESRALGGTEGASFLFFSPDAKWIGFFADGWLKKVSLDGQTALRLCEAPAGRGGSWAPNDAIIFAPERASGLSLVPASGGTPETLTTLDPQTKDISHRWPEVLPDGQTVVYQSYNDAGRSLAALDLRSGRKRIIIDGGWNARYSPTGHLVFGKGPTLFAAPFDPDRLQLTGPSVPVLEGVGSELGFSFTAFHLSRTGLLAYTPRAERAIVWVDRLGSAQRVSSDLRPFESVRLSPDGGRIVASIDGDIWLYAMEREMWSRRTFDPVNNDDSPVWSPDGLHIAYSSDRGGGNTGIYRISADGDGEPALLIQEDLYNDVPSAWSPDGHELIFSRAQPSGNSDLWVVPIEGDGAPAPYIATKFNERGAAFSPNGRWLAYESDASGQVEVYVRSYSGRSRAIQVSSEGGRSPVFSRDGRELYFRRGRAVMAAPMDDGQAVAVGKARRLFDGEFDNRFDVRPTGDFLMVQRFEPRMHVVFNWFEELKRLVPTDN